jgi:hypothetical protein
MNSVILGWTMVGYNQFDTDTVVDADQVNGTTILIMGCHRLSTSMGNPSSALRGGSWITIWPLDEWRLNAWGRSFSSACTSDRIMP